MKILGVFLLLLARSTVHCETDDSFSPTEEFVGYDAEMSVGCYFPAEFQGEFVTQVGGKAGIDAVSNEPIQYSTINITFNSIPVWGYCHKRVGDNVLLKDRYGNGECIRCFRLLRRSRNVIEVFSEDLNRCYTYESSAIASCSTLNSTSILYRTKEIGGEPIRNEYCPIVGRYHFKYSLNGESNRIQGCDSFTSNFSNCPDGSILDLKFSQCSFDDQVIVSHCLGDWSAGPDGSRYIALLDFYAENRTRYRCGMYNYDTKKGKMYLSMSSDSSCSQNLYNSTHGYETYVLSKMMNTKKMPPYLESHQANFPKWAQGEWEESLIVNGTMTFTDLNGYNRYVFVNVESNDETGRYVVYSRDQCEQEVYVCLMMRQRSENILEFAIGMVMSPIHQNYLCDDPNFDKPVWMTQARIERAVESPCPITGQYTGMITDLSGMCAELSSNCHTREIMYFRVSDCESGELYEERTYLCLGQWEERGVMYTYTMRNETNTNECFVGLIVSDEEIYIKEAGDHCIRNIDPKEQGMRLYKKGQCYGNSPSPAPTPVKAIPHDPIMRITHAPSSKAPGSYSTTPKPGKTVPSKSSIPEISHSLIVTVFLIVCLPLYSFRHVNLPWT